MSMKKCFILNILCFLLFLEFGKCSESKYECYENNRQMAQTNSLVSGICFDRFIEQPPKAVITLGFMELGGIGKRKIKHASLVFECPEKQKNDIVINIQGVHLTTKGDGYFAPGGVGDVICGSGSARILEESADDVIKAFVRCKETKTIKKANREGVLEVIHEEITKEAKYSKFKSFVVTARKAQEALDLIKKDKGNVHFAAFGWYLGSKNTFNCCTYAARLLRAAGVEIDDSDYKALVLDHRYLEGIINAYIKKNKALNDGVEILDPPSAEELIASAHIGRKPVVRALINPAAAIEEREPRIARELRKPAAPKVLPQKQNNGEMASDLAKALKKRREAIGEEEEKS